MHTIGAVPIIIDWVNHKSFLNVHFQWKYYDNYMFHFQSVAVQHIYLWMEFFFFVCQAIRMFWAVHMMCWWQSDDEHHYECEKVLKNQSLYIVFLIRPENEVRLTSTNWAKEICRHRRHCHRLPWTWMKFQPRSRNFDRLKRHIVSVAHES